MSYLSRFSLVILICLALACSTLAISCNSLPNSCQTLKISIPPRESSVGYYGLNTNFNNTVVQVFLAAQTYSGGWYKYNIDYTEEPGCPGTGSYVEGTFTASNSTPIINVKTGVLPATQMGVSIVLTCDDLIESCQDSFKLCVAQMCNFCPRTNLSDRSLSNVNLECPQASFTVHNILSCELLYLCWTMTSAGKGLSPALLRLMSDYKTIMEDPPEGASAAPVRDDNLFVWEATIFGPEECMWEGGIFRLSLKFSEEYPTKPPKVRFICPIFHPNVYADGSLCLDIIQDKWSPIYSSLLTDPNPASPANPAAANLLKNDPNEYKKRVKKCVQKSQEEAFA